MLSRRHLRVKVLQALYAYFQTETPDMNKGERDLFQSIEKFHDTYLYILLLITELSDMARINAADALQKYIPTEKSTDKSVRFIESPVIRQLLSNRNFLGSTKQRKLTWQKEIELVRKLFMQLKRTDEYREYLENPDTSFKVDQDFLIWLVKKFLSVSDLLNHHIEEINIHWPGDDKDFLFSMVQKTIKMFGDEEAAQPEFLTLLPVFKDDEDDRDFVKQLYRQTIVHNHEYEADIAERTKNWDVERIALTDIILMKMALTEIVTFSSIPVKVSINEYIDISKDYSTPKSKIFINGIIDGLVADYRLKDKIKKTGRGLME